MTKADSLLKEPWRNFSRQRKAGEFGIWIFLASEVLFFGALLVAYTIGRIENAEAFARAARETNIWYGTINTAILLTSSLTIAVASQASSIHTNARRLILGCLAATVAMGIAFLVLKGFEYKEDIDKYLLPGASFSLPQPGAQLFYGFYWLVTGVHAVHLSIGILLVSRLVLLGARHRMELSDNPEIEVTALYWHLVDIIWIVLYPLIYLPGRAQ